jgi:hypothetical protein
MRAGNVSLRVQTFRSRRRGKKKSGVNRKTIAGYFYYSKADIFADELKPFRRTFSLTLDTTFRANKTARTALLKRREKALRYSKKKLNFMSSQKRIFARAAKEPAENLI